MFSQILAMEKTQNMVFFGPILKKNLLAHSALAVV
jgi:hypothetical protein